MNTGVIRFAALVALGVSSFCAGAVRVIQPNGGENIVSGSTYQIQWSCGSLVAEVRIDFSFTDGAAWDTVAGYVPCANGTGKYSWNVPDVSSGKCLIHIFDVLDPRDIDQSDNVFTVYPCKLPMDFNDDCQVDFVDLAIFGAKWLGCGNPYDVACLDNRVPVITSVPVLQGQVGVDYLYAVTANDTDGDVLTFGLAKNPEGMTVSPTSGEISWTPNASQEGSHTVIVQVTDDVVAADYQAFEIDVAPPLIVYENTGAPVDGFPSLRERRGLVYTNAVRMAPLAYRDKYMADWSPPPGGILELYGAVDPLYYNSDLNAAARFHVEDMATDCGLQHDSCDGTRWSDRIRSFYTCSGSIGENAAWGFNGARQTVNQFLCDKTGSNCAPDGSAYEGHRKNIMSQSWTEVGHGYTDPYWWVQDFGGCALDEQPAIAAAGHDFLEDGKTSFLLNYFDVDSASPASVQVVVDGVPHDMSLDIGVSHRGTYRVDIDRADQCRTYYFLAVTAAQEGWRYPGPGAFMTVGEGTCTDDYVTP